MSPKEAIDYLLDPIGKREMHDEAIEMAVEALKRQIPEKTGIPELGISKKHPVIIPCGNCSNELESRMWEYCPWCGQAIDWSVSK